MKEHWERGWGHSLAHSFCITLKRLDGPCRGVRCGLLGRAARRQLRAPLEGVHCLTRRQVCARRRQRYNGSAPPTPARTRCCGHHALLQTLTHEIMSKKRVAPDRHCSHVRPFSSVQFSSVQFSSVQFSSVQFRTSTAGADRPRHSRCRCGPLGSTQGEGAGRCGPPARTAGEGAGAPRRTSHGGTVCTFTA